MVFRFSFKYIQLFLAFFLILSCSNDDNIQEQIVTCDDGIQNGDELGIDCGGSCIITCFDETNLDGFLVTRRILSAGIEYALNGPYIIRDGAQLDIEAGTVIKATNPNAYIAVAQGGKIYIYGTENNPVIMTSASENPQPGDWGGLIICGQAPTNNGINARSELGDIFYGGTNAVESSGTIRYLRLEYTGAQFRDDYQFNAFTLYGVGSTSNFHDIQAYKSLGNGFEIFGGAVNLSNLVALECNASGVKISGGWNGNGQSWFLSQLNNAGLELGNNTLDLNAVPITDGYLSDISINGPLQNAIFFADGGGVFSLNNLYTSGLQLGINSDGALPNAFINDGFFTINTIEFDNPLTGFIPTNYSGNTNFYSEGINNGSGNRDLAPQWTQNWTTGF